MKNTAVIILNRNLPEVTDALHDMIKRNNDSYCDIFILEAGSDPDKLSRNCTWYVESEDVKKNGLRMPRGINYSIRMLLESEQFQNYKYFFFLPNDVEFAEKPFIKILHDEMEEHPRLGILSPASRRWGETALIGPKATRYFWAVEQLAWFMRREYIEALLNRESAYDGDFFYDGNNFRGFYSNLEMITKGYVNDWASGITTKVWITENENHLKTMSDLIGTESYDENIRMYLQEGNAWIKKKYGYASKWPFYMYSKFLYDRFFIYFPELKRYEV